MNAHPHPPFHLNDFPYPRMEEAMAAITSSSRPHRSNPNQPYLPPLVVLKTDARIRLALSSLYSAGEVSYLWQNILRVAWFHDDDANSPYFHRNYTVVESLNVGEGRETVLSVLDGETDSHLLVILCRPTREIADPDPNVSNVLLELLPALRLLDRGPLEGARVCFGFAVGYVVTFWEYSLHPVRGQTWELVRERPYGKGFLRVCVGIREPALVERGLLEDDDKVLVARIGAIRRRVWVERRMDRREVEERDIEMGR